LHQNPDDGLDLRSGEDGQIDVFGDARRRLASHDLRNEARLVFQKLPGVVVLQKMGGDIKGLPRTPTYAAIMKRLDTNLTCLRMSPLPTPSICPFLMMFIISCPLIVRRAVLKLKKPRPGLTRRFVG
jgi:hypothetical protein